MKLESGFEIVAHSDSCYEKITTLIIYGDAFIAQLNMDDGFDNIEIGLLADPVDGATPRFLLRDFLEAIDVAKKRLSEYVG